MREYGVMRKEKGKKKTREEVKKKNTERNKMSET
jgi:hypothetical protein